MIRTRSSAHRSLVAFATLAAVAASCGRSTPESAGIAQPAGVSVTADVARLDTLRDVVVTPGTVVPSSLGETLVIPPGPATITELPKKEGDTVAVNDVLARFEIAAITQDLAARELEVTEATGRVNRAKDAMDKQTALADRGLTARNTLEAAKAELTSAQFALAQANTQRDAVRARQDISVVRARTTGVVSKIFHGEGELVSGSPGDPVLRVIDPTKVQVAIQVPVAQLGRIGPGQVATISLIGAISGEPATVVFKAPIIDTSAPTSEVRLNLNGPTALAVDTAVSVEILIDQRPNVIVVAATAVRRDESGPFVLVAGDDGRAHRRIVKTGLALRDRVEVMSGLTAGEKVITSGFDQLSDGTAVVIER